MARVQHHHGLRVGGARRSLRKRRRRSTRHLRRLRLLQLGKEGLLVGRHEVDDKPRRLIVTRFKHEGLVDEERPAHIDDDARFSRCEQSIAIGGDEPPLLLADAVGHLEAHIGRIDDDPVGIAEREDVHIDLLRKIGDEASALAVAGNARVLGDRER